MPRARVDPSPQGPHLPWYQAVPLLLLGDHLTAADKLACFQVNKGMAELLLRHTPRPKLSLTLPGQQASSSAASTVSTSSRTARAQQKVTQQLAAQACNVALVLHGGLFSPAPCMWQCIFSIHLHGVRLLPQDLSSHSQLQLHNLAKLHTFSLQHCSMGGDTSSSSSSRSRRQGRVASSVRVLQCVDCTPSSAPLLRMALSVVDPAQLQMLACDDTAAADLLAQLPSLQEVRLLVAPPRGHDAQSGHPVDDDVMDNLLAHPGLARVVLGYVKLQHDHSGRACSWDSLRLGSGATVRTLAALPLADIKSCTICCFISGREPVDDVEFDQAMNNLSCCQHLSLEPVTLLMTASAGPSFVIHMLSCRAEQASQLIALAMGHMVNGMLTMVHHASAFTSPPVLAALAAAPARLTGMCFLPCSLGAAGGTAVGQGQGGVVAHLPAHVSHVVLPGLQEGYQGIGLEVLNVFMTGVTRPIKLTLLGCGLPWSEGAKQAMSQWLHIHANPVQVEFVCGTSGFF